MNNSTLGISTKGIIKNGADSSNTDKAVVITADKTDIALTNVACTNVINQSTQTVRGIRVVRCYESSPLEQEMPDEEKAVQPDGDFYRMEAALTLISTPDLAYMANLQGVLNNCLYAGIREDSKGDRSVIYCQRYSNGMLSAKMEIIQADIMAAGKYISGYNQSKTIPRKISRILEGAEERYNNRFSGDPAECIDINEIISALYTTLPALPVHHNSTHFERWDFYQQVEGIARFMTSQVFDNHTMYYPLMECDIVDIAVSLKMRKMELLKKLRDCGFLYITLSSRGYQTNVAIQYADGSTGTEWRYCLVKLNNIAGIDSDSGADTFDF